MSAPNRPDLGGMRVLLDSALLGGMDDPDTHTFVYFYASTLLTYAKRLEAEVERLRGLVPPAFHEGWELCALRTGCIVGSKNDWEHSDTRAALNPEVNP
jgi:hypothetical protein